MSRPPSPLSKRQRLSSPTYDDQYSLSQDELRAFDNFELSQSQQPVPLPRPSQAFPTSSRIKRSQRIAFALYDNEDEERGHGHAGNSSQAPSQGDGGIDLAAPLFKERNNTAEGHIASHEAHGRPSGFASAASLAQLTQSNTRTDEENRIDAADDDTVNTVTPHATGFGFASALQVAADPLLDSTHHTPSSSPDAPVETDYSDWFKPAPIPEGAISFQSAKALTIMDSATENTDPTTGTSVPMLGFASARDMSYNSQSENIPEMSESSSSMLTGFTSGLKLVNPTITGAKNWAVPSAEALERAAQKMKAWQKEIEEDPMDLSALEPTGDLPPNMALKTPSRPALRAVDNTQSPAQIPDSPGSPTPASRSSSRERTSVLDARKSLQARPKGFKSPLLNQASKPESSSSYVGSPLNPNRPSEPAVRLKLPAAFPIAAPAVASTSTLLGFSPVRPASSASGQSRVSGMKALGVTPRRMGIAGRPKFKTPFKPGMKPGEQGRAQLEQKQASQHEPEKPTTVSVVGEKTGTKTTVQQKAKKVFGYFDLTPPPGRQTLATSGLVPQSHTSSELEAMGIDVSELDQITPVTARYYSFLPSSVQRQTATCKKFDLLGAEAAYHELHDRGCLLASRYWVTNHWCLILWKLAGMVALDPASESDPATRRWSWREVVRQLMYRYERELDGSARPALRLITTHDAPASCPMVLCVSNVTWSDAGTDEHGQARQKPELEVTDGWYRLRAEIDDALERAVGKGVLRIGRKIAVAGARLMSDSKDPFEILDASDSVSLQLGGNASHMAPWHAKLGFVEQEFVTTLDSLTSDGGLVPLMDVVVVKTYPIAFVQFIECGGETIQDGPWDEKEEARKQEQWMVRRESEQSKLRDEFEKKLAVLEGYAERLERMAGSDFCPKEWDSPPDEVENWFYRLESNDNIVLLFGGMHPVDAGWLARHIRTQCAKNRERLHDEIRGDLDSLCPPREVRAFRVVVVKDAQWVKREPLRQAQITIWDILRLTFSEGGKPGAIQVGQRFKVSNCMPSQRSAWMKAAAGSEVYLTAWRGSRWMRVK